MWACVRARSCGLVSVFTARGSAGRQQASFVIDRGLSTSQSRYDRLMRVAKKVYGAKTGEEREVISDRLEDTEQARAIASMEAYRRYGQPFKKRAQDKKQQQKTPPAETEEEQAAVEEDKREMLENDYLPKGFSLTDLPRFEKIPPWDKHNQKLRKLARNLSHVHKKDNNVIIEGKRLLIDAIKAGNYPQVLVFSRLNTLVDIPFDKEKSLAMYQVSYRNVSTWSALNTSPGIIASFSKEEIELNARSVNSTGSLPLTLILERF